MDLDNVRVAIRDGARTVEAIAAHPAVDKHPGHATKMLKEWAEEDRLTRERRGRRYVYGLTGEDVSTGADGGSEEGRVGAADGGTTRATATETTATTPEGKCDRCGENFPSLLFETLALDGCPACNPEAWRSVPSREPPRATVEHPVPRAPSPR